MSEHADIYHDAVRALRHDARNLLNALELSRDHFDSSEDEKGKRLVAYLEEKIAAMVRLAERADVLAKIEPAEGLSEERVDGLVSRALASLDLDKSKLTIQLAEQKVRCDPLLAELALAEVLSNALHTGKPVTVRFDDASNAIVVKDEGPGISEMAQPQLRNPFRGAKRPGGSSVGIPIADRAMRSQHGSLEVSSDQRGAEVRFEFPSA